ASEVVITLARPRVADGVLRGKVVDSAFAPVAGARVACGVDTTKSEDDGSFSIRLDDPKSFGKRFGVEADLLQAVKKGYLPARWEPPRKEGPPDWPAFVPLKLGLAPLSIRGRVLGTDRQPLAGAKVWIADATLFGAGQRGPQHIENILAGEEDAIWRAAETDAQGR